MVRHLFRLPAVDGVICGRRQVELGRFAVRQQCSSFRAERAGAPGELCRNVDVDAKPCLAEWQLPVIATGGFSIFRLRMTRGAGLIQAAFA